ncbi:hypothetical protein LDL08_07825 [Nonomuraea glycinis]|uniref:Uncharacterized protein n=1 Tax=Nonomuraea glycinis TaxID=2047744 RepID=A0A918AEE3_9ACTN|nr:hypothetical protein [Nonomuraea glycinis]MCA2176085.1 hypothetical protein [Nonomuraea glycinis]GGP17966.1 hypothetical protein GCM10012278_88430 [Nonomuraea glycinis]
MNELNALEGWGFPVRTSRGGEARGRSIADQAERMVEWLNKLVGEFRIPTLYVVGADDWAAVAAFPVYGMPHAEADRIVVGQEPAQFWTVVLDSVAPVLAGHDRAELRRVYGDPVTLSSFADLLVSHEIGHYLHSLGEPANPTAFWLREMLANLALQGYVSEVEPQREEALLTVVRIVWGGSRQWPLYELRDMFRAPELDGSNYVWFEFGLQTLTKRLWANAGATALRCLIDMLNGPALTHDEAIDAIHAIDPGVAADLRRWPHFLAT